VGVVAWAALRGALQCAQVPEPIPERSGRVLAAAIAVEDEARDRPSSPNRRIEHGAREVGAAPPPQRPREDAARILIHHDGEESPSAANGDVGDVADPDLVESARAGSAQAVRVLIEEVVQLGIPAVDPRGARAESGVAHQARHASATCAHSLRPQRSKHPGTAIDSPMRGEDAPDVFEELPVLVHSRARRPVTPRVVARAGHVEQRTEPRQRERVALRVDEDERVGLRSEQNGMAFFSRACSVWSSACSRSSCCSR